MDDTELKQLLDFDALDAAERLTGGDYKEDKGVMALGFLLHLEGTSKKAEALTAQDDTTFSNKLGRYQRIVEEEGFRKVLELPLPEDCQGDRFFVYYHSDGMLLVFDTYHGDSVNSAKLYFNLRWKNNKPVYSLVCSIKPIDENTFAGDYDAREGFRFHIRQLREAGTLLNPWAKAPFLWLLHHRDTDDYKAINKERLALLPVEVQKMIGSCEG